MKIDGGRIIDDFIELNKRQYAIPVYQRNYEWSREQCEKLFEDIIEASKNDKDHFCGSIVFAPINSGTKISTFVIVDGQQRLTTIYLLLKALIDCADTERKREKLEETVFNKDKWNELAIDKATKLKLKPIKSDDNQLKLLMDNKYDKIDKNSGIWINYSIFVELVKDFLDKYPEADVTNIFHGIERLTCAMIKLSDDDNAQEIFERINSTGIPLSLADQIRNFVLMTDENQEKLYEEYWLKLESLISKKQMSEFFLNYLNIKLDGFAKEVNAYDKFKKFYKDNKFTNEGVLKDITHYAEFYNVFVNGSDRYSDKVNEYLSGLRQLNQGTCYLFLFRVFDDYADGKIKEEELEKVLQLLLSYSIRRLMCEISSNSLRGMYKTLYNRIFTRTSSAEHYYDSIVSFMKQMTSRDAIPGDWDFHTALINNSLYPKHALCRYLLIAIENQGKEKLVTDNLSIEHVMPQTKNLSTNWRNMLGENWEADRERWLHTLGNLTLTGYNSELGDKPFDEKKQLIEEKKTKVIELYKDIKSADTWNAQIIETRAERLAVIIEKLFPIVEPEVSIQFNDPNYREYTAAEPQNAKWKAVSSYELLGERSNVSSFADMVRSVAKKLYELDSEKIEKMARKNEKFTNWINVPFSYDKNRVKSGIYRILGTDIYMSSGYSAPDCIEFIRCMLKLYNLSIDEDFIYVAKDNNPDRKTEG